jgi:hypothetical protein
MSYPGGFKTNGTLREDFLPNIYKGKIELFSCRPNKLKPGWYVCNGEYYLLASPQGQALAGLDEDFKEDWGIIINGDNIRLPSLFDDDGKGYFLRPVDGVTLLPGRKQGDAMQNITASTEIYGTKLKSAPASSGAYTDRLNILNITFSTTQISDRDWLYVPDFDASNVVPTDDENRPINIGFVPAIYLGA